MYNTADDWYRPLKNEKAQKPTLWTTGKDSVWTQNSIIEENYYQKSWTTSKLRLKRTKVKTDIYPERPKSNDFRQSSRTTNVKFHQTTSCWLENFPEVL